jgi:hypothetical protein
MMNTAHANVFLEAMSSQVRTSIQQWHLHKPNIVFANLFLWFVNQYGKTTAENREANRQRMAANRHPTNGFDALILHLFNGAAYASSTGFKINNVGIIDIGLRIIKRWGMYGKEYKAWIACEAVHPCIVKMVDKFKKCWAAKITLVNQTAISAIMHGFGMATVNDDDSIVLYGELIVNFGAAYATTQEWVQSQGTTIALMQGQIQAMQQYCMALGQQTPPGIHTLQQQQCGRRGSSHQPSTGSRRNPAPTSYQQPGRFPGGQRPLQPPTPFKTFENWNYCHTRGGDVDNTHTGMSRRHPGPLHNPNTARMNTMGGITAGLNRTVLPSTSSCVPPAPRQPQAPTPPMW